MYKIFADDVLIYDSTLDDYKIGKGQVTKEAGKSGSFVFSLYPDHFYYDSFIKMRTVITVYKSGRIVFRGRVLDDVVDYWNCKSLTCEGELSFLQDAIIRPYEFSGTPADLFKRLVTEYNHQVDEFKRFKIGSCTVKDLNGYITRSNTGYETALSNMTSRLLDDATGGHLYITHGDDGTDPIPTLHYLADFPNVSTQSIEFGKNLKDYTKKTDGAGIATAIIPLGATVDDGNNDTEDRRLTIASVNSGKDYVYSEAGVALYGWLFKVVEWDDVTDASILMAKGRAEADRSADQNITIELNAIDMHLLDRNIASYNCCDYIPVSSAPHNFAATLLCNKQTLDLLKPDNDTVTLGHAYQTFTEYTTRTTEAVVTKLSRQVASCVVRIEMLEGVTVYVVVADQQDQTATMLTTVGALTVAGQAITSESQTLTVTGGRASVTYTLTQNLDTARTVFVDGVELGAVSKSGDTVSTEVTIHKGDPIYISFV